MPLTPLFRVIPPESHGSPTIASIDMMPPASSALYCPSLRLAPVCLFSAATAHLVELVGSNTAARFARPSRTGQMIYGYSATKKLTARNNLSLGWRSVRKAGRHYARLTPTERTCPIRWKQRRMPTMREASGVTPSLGSFLTWQLVPPCLRASSGPRILNACRTQNG